MAKRSNSKIDSELEVNSSDEEITTEEVSYLNVISLQEGRKTVTGAVTGDVYTFPGAGAIVPVQEEDARIMVEKRNRSCCTGYVSRFFEIVQEG